MDKASLKDLVRKIVIEMTSPEVPIGISNRHLHLKQEDYDVLFPNQPVKKKKNLKQPGEFAAEQTVTIIGPKGEIPNVRLLAPLRNISQVEISKTDARKLGVNASVSLSGDLSKAEEITLKTKDGSITIKGCIIAKRHIHMNTKEAASLDLKKGDIVKVEVDTPQRKTIFDDVVIRPHENFVLEMHIDTDEANAANISSDTRCRIIT
ncbi:phosphate propanoyltransferase [Desemzia sp. C1]|uniref:phosphate propanoyltransferase n=1 Tax=Desemzia sp. C1 TaxID=2892016 RepID=UPI001E61FB1F|nr:phosphate propanoyltransferase [Desemzia sp. C1]MCI3029303.1 phosphate propanoyltransferase [Desemzia sp. C1]